jgi:(heptosyl)LPS beta-1,4-glucosyltransferase
MRISAVIITFNEERNIGRCIRSIQAFADEIIVLDSFSTDRTPQICMEEGVKFHQREWAGYSNAKNYLNSLATGDMIFSIDADEAVDEDLCCELMRVKGSRIMALYEVNRITNYCGKWIRHSGWYPDIKLRLFPANVCKWEGAYVHEELVCKGDWSKITLAGHLEHYSYYDYKDHRMRADKYSALTAQKMHQAGKRAGILKPLLSGIGRFIAMFLIKKGFLDGKMGFMIAWISAQSNVFKYRELRRLNKLA